MPSPSNRRVKIRLTRVPVLLRINAGEEGDKLIAGLDQHFERDSGSLPHGHNQKIVQDAGKGVKHVAARK